MKTTDSGERLKILMRKQSALAEASAPPPAAIAPVVAKSLLASQSPLAPTNRTSSAVKWDRVTIRLTAGELEKINEVVIATQQANRTAKVTTTDVLRTALRRVEDGEAIQAADIQALRAQDARSSERRNVRQSQSQTV